MSLKSKEKEAPSAPRRAPLDWAAVHCLKLHGEGPQARSLLSPEYLVAEILYGWSAQAYHFGADSFQLTEDDFFKALEAAGKFPVCAPHSAGVPPIAIAKFKKFKPKKAK